MNNNITEIVGYVYQYGEVKVYKLDIGAWDRWFVVQYPEQKVLECLNLEHALGIFEVCVGKFKQEEIVQ